MFKFEDLQKVCEKNGFKFEFFKTKDELKKELKNLVKEDDRVDFGGSVSLQELKLYEEFKDEGIDVYWHWIDKEKTRLGNIYLTSTNALTEDGKLVNMDGVGNRVTSMITGYENVYIVVGQNKLVKNYDEAIARIRNIAAPLNAKRLNLNTPCVKTGKCEDCSSPERICRAETIIHKNPGKTQINIMFIGEEIGY